MTVIEFMKIYKSEIDSASAHLKFKPTHNSITAVSRGCGILPHLRKVIIRSGNRSFMPLMSKMICRWLLIKTTVVYFLIIVAISIPELYRLQNRKDLNL